MPMPDEFPTEGLPNFLPPNPSEPLYHFQYFPQLEASCRTLPPAQEGVYRASIIAHCPTNNEEWQAVGVQAGVAVDVYQDVVLGTFAGSARDPEVAATMLEQLRMQDEVVRERIPAELMETIAVRTLNTPDAHPDAATNIVQWAFESVPDAEAQASALGRVVRHKTAEQLAKLAPIFQELGQAGLSGAVAETLQQHERRLADQAERERAAEERQAAEAEQKRIAEERRSYIVNNPLQAFREVAGMHTLETQEDIAQAELTDAHELLFAASVVTSQAESHSFAINETDQPTADLASAILDRAVNLRRDGRVFEDPHHNHINYNLDKHEERPVIGADSVDNFWNELARLAEWRDSINPAQVSSLYEEWRSSFISRRQIERAAIVLAEHDINPDTDFVPEGMHSAEISVPYGSVAYETVDELVSDMRAYFVPRMDRFEPGVVAKNAVENAVGSASAASMLSRINRPDEDSINMDRLEEEIKEWVVDGLSDTYRDSYDTGGGDPYKYSGGLFTGHGISITRGTDGQLQLNLQGRGYSGGGLPTGHIDDFAAFVGKDIIYEGTIGLTYTGQPPTEIVRTTRERIRRGETTTEGMVMTSLPVGAAFEQLQQQVGLSTETVDALWGIVTSDFRESRDNPQVIDGDLVVGVSTYNSIPEGAQRDENGNLRGQNYAPEENENGRRYFFLPSFGLKLNSTDPVRQFDLAQTFHAMGVLNRSRPRKSYPHGYVGGYGSFNLTEDL